MVFLNKFSISLGIIFVFLSIYKVSRQKKTIVYIDDHRTY